MTIRGQVSTDALGSALPLNRPAYGYGRPAWTQTDMLAFRYVTDARAAAAVLPEHLELDDHPRAALVFYNYGVSSVGPYREAIQQIEVTLDGRRANWIRHIYVTNDNALVGGRELIGNPKLLGAIDFDRSRETANGLFQARLERPSGVPLAYGVFQPQVFDGPVEGVRETWLGLRRVPALTGGPAALDEYVRTEVEVRAEEMWRGTGAPAFTGYSALDPLHQIPVVEPVEAVLGINMTLTPVGMESVSVTAINDNTRAATAHSGAASGASREIS